MAHSLAEVFRNPERHSLRKNSSQMRRYVLDIGIPADQRWPTAFAIFEASLDQLESHLNMRAGEWIPSRQEEVPDPRWQQLFWQKMTLEHHLARYSPNPIADNTSSISWYTASLAAIFPGCVQGALFSHLRELEASWGEAVPTWRLPPLLQRVDRAFRLGVSAIPGINLALRRELLEHASPYLEEVLNNPDWESIVVIGDNSDREQERQRAALILELALIAFESGHSNDEERRFEEAQAMLSRWRGQVQVALADYSDSPAVNLVGGDGCDPASGNPTSGNPTSGDTPGDTVAVDSDIIPIQLRQDINHQLQPLLFSAASMLGPQSYRNRQHQGL